MAKDILMPMLSPSMTEGTLVRWIKKEGDAVKSGDVLAEVETDKATMDLEAFDAGILRKILVGEGEKVAVNARVRRSSARRTRKDRCVGARRRAEERRPRQGRSAQAGSRAAGSQERSGCRRRSQAFRTNGRPSQSFTAGAQDRAGKACPNSRTSPAPVRAGRIVKDDVLHAAINGRSSSGGSSVIPRGPIAPEGRQKLSSIRSVIAKRLLESKTQIPHFYLEIEIDAAPILDLREQLNASLALLKPPVKLSLNDFILKAAAEAIRRVPAVNASFDGDAIAQHADVQLAFAVAIPDGLITPIVREAQNKSLVQIGVEARALAAKAKDGKLKPEEFQGGTFTVSNLGMLGIDSFCAIINPPQAAILAVGNIVKKPVVGPNDEIVVGHRQSLTLSCDHRVVDGAVGAAYLKELRELLEKPAGLLL